MWPLCILTQPLTASAYTQRALKYCACARKVSDVIHGLHILRCWHTPRRGVRGSQVPRLRTECAQNVSDFSHHSDLLLFVAIHRPYLLLVLAICCYSLSLFVAICCYAHRPDLLMFVAICCYSLSLFVFICCYVLLLTVLICCYLLLFTVLICFYCWYAPCVLLLPFVDIPK